MDAGLASGFSSVVCQLTFPTVTINLQVVSSSDQGFHLFLPISSHNLIIVLYQLLSLAISYMTRHCHQLVVAMESWMNIFDINVRRQSDGACQKIVCHKYKRYEVRRRRNVPKRFSETRQKLRVLLLEDSAGDAANTVGPPTYRIQYRETSGGSE
jgi:hypothetical protein